MKVLHNYLSIYIFFYLEFFAGQIETNKKEWATKGERSQTVVHSDNLKLEGQMQGMNIFCIVLCEKETQF